MCTHSFIYYIHGEFVFWSSLISVLLFVTYIGVNFLSKFCWKCFLSLWTWFLFLSLVLLCTHFFYSVLDLLDVFSLDCFFRFNTFLPETLLLKKIRNFKIISPCTLAEFYLVSCNKPHVIFQIHVISVKETMLLWPCMWRQVKRRKRAIIFLFDFTIVYVLYII